MNIVFYVVPQVLKSVLVQLGESAPVEYRVNRNYCCITIDDIRSFNLFDNQYHLSYERNTIKLQAENVTSFAIGNSK